METEQWAEQAHAIWKFLPLHPHPQVRESFTGYLIRLAEANQLKNMSELVALVGIPRRRLSNLYLLPDGPAPSYYASLSQLTGCSQERLVQTTFVPFVQRFGCSTNPHSLHRFLAGSLAPCLRYCPLCLESSSTTYYSLLWRFLVLPGCMLHGVYLLSRCGSCGSSLPLLSSCARLAWCPTCRTDLRMCEPRSLSQEARTLTHRYTQELSMLLDPTPSPLIEAQSQGIGKRCRALRQERDLSITEMARLSGLEVAVIMNIERVSNFTKASFSDYMRYVDAQGFSFLEVFDTNRLQESLTTPSQELALKQVAAAIEQLKRQGEPITRRNIANLVGKDMVRLGHYPQVDKLLAQSLKGRGPMIQQMKAEREEEIIKLMQKASQDLEAKGVRVSRRRLCHLVGMSRAALRRYPRANELLRQLVEQVEPQNLQKVVQDAVEQALLLGLSLSYRRISELTGLSLSVLMGNEQARAIIQRAQNERRQLRVNALVSRVEHALEALGKETSVSRISQLVGMDRTSLLRYPQIRALLLSLQ
jgi:transcriptional regulator with XRE-family HTH domain